MFRIMEREIVESGQPKIKIDVQVREEMKATIMS